ncbi:MAG: hypothetical protein IJW94_03240 [Oscillospiraceae bacterium]|nr:hypothetical protein [Oscillospiraceae bacterium]
MNKKAAIHSEKLYSAILSLKTIDECAAFFEDICTIQELQSLQQRLEVAIALSQGSSYVDVNKSTGASTATICRVSKALNYGDGGYKTVIERLEQNDD